jgi:FkbM family methyltransferase
MELHHDEALSDHIRATGDFFEAEILDYIRDKYPDHRTIVDIGANIGNHSVYFANFLKYEAILAFEPLAENFELLKRNLVKYEGIGAVQNAVGNYTGVAHMTKNISNMGAGEIQENGEIPVPIIALDRIGLQDVTLMKIDVEWYEPQVLEGAQDTIFKCKPLILIEDANNAYGPLLPDYELIKAWPHHKTYLYGWKNATAT